MTRVIGILSGKGGVGKTTATVNIGASLAFDYGNNVVAIDANTTSSSLGLYLGNHKFPVTINEVLTGKASIADAIYAHPSGLKVIPSSHGFNGVVNNKRIKSVVNSLKEFTDFILLDCPPTLGSETRAGIEAVDELIVIANPNWASLLEAKKTIEYAKQLKKKVLGLVLNQADLEPEEIDKIKKALKIDILSVIPLDDNVVKSSDKRVPVIHLYGRSRPARAYKKLMEKITGEKFPNRGIIERIIGWFD